MVLILTWFAIFGGSHLLADAAGRYSVGHQAPHLLILGLVVSIVGFYWTEIALFVLIASSFNGSGFSEVDVFSGAAVALTVTVPVLLILITIGNLTPQLAQSAETPASTLSFGSVLSEFAEQLPQPNRDWVARNVSTLLAKHPELKPELITDIVVESLGGVRLLAQFVFVPAIALAYFKKRRGAALAAA